MKRAVPSCDCRVQRGSVLVVALVVAAVIALSLGGFLRLAVLASKLSQRTFYANAARDLLDTGLEHTLWSLNHNDWTAAAGFASRMGHSGEYQGIFPSASTYYLFSEGVKGQVRVWVDTTNVVDGVSTPHAVAQAAVALADGSTIIKEAEIYLRQRSLAAQALVARSGLIIDGNLYADSWDSFSDTPSTADDVAYSTSVRRPELRIAAASVAVNSPSQSANIYGFATVDPRDATGVTVGSDGRLSGNFVAGVGVDPNRVAHDFTTNFPDVAEPSVSGYDLADIAETTTLPRGGDAPAADGAYYYRVPTITLTGTETMNVGPAVVDATHLPSKVVLVMANSMGTTVSTSDSAAINVGPQSTLVIYTAGDVHLAGRGAVNGTPSIPNNPDSFQLYGTRTAATADVSGLQSIAVKGDGYLSANLCVPNGRLTVNCDNDTYGAVVGDHVTLTGDGRFHGDESLKRKSSSGIWGPAKWRELLTPTERAAYADKLAF